MLRLTVADRWVADLTGPIDLSIPLRFGGPQPNAFGLPRASASSVVSTRDGGPVNCVTVTLNPHGNGTHTECAAHVFTSVLDVRDAAPRSLLPCCVVSVTPREGGVQSADLALSLEGVPAAFLGAVVLRTGQTRNDITYSGTNPPHVTVDAMRCLRTLGVDHLLVDLPSVDPEDDGGAVLAHRVFFESGVAARTITEMIRVPDDVPDGLYVLSLHVPPFVQDAAPSRPVIFPVHALK